MQEQKDWVQLQSDIKKYRSVLREAATTVVDENVSNYPILVAYAGGDSDKVPGVFVTEILTDRDLIWTINVSTLEELVAKQIVGRERIDPFRKVYKEHADEFCFLIIDAAGARFGFVPNPTA